MTVVKRDGDKLYIADVETGDGVSEISDESLQSEFTGVVLFAAKSLMAIESEMVKPPERGHWFWGKLRSQWKLLNDAILGSFFANVLAACIALFTLQVYDRVIPHQSLVTLWVLVVGVGVAIVLEAGLRIARAHLLDTSGRKLEVDLSNFLFERFLGARLSNTAMSPGARVHAIREFSSVREFFTTASISSAADIPFAIIFLGLIYAIAGNVAFVILVAMGLIILPSLLAQKKILKISEEMLDSSSVSNRILIETAYAHESIKSNQAEGFFQERFDDITRLISVKTTKQRLLSASLTYSANVIQQFCYVTAIVFGVYMVFAGDFTVGAIIAISILSSRTLTPMTQLATIITRWKQVRVSLDSLEHIAQSEQERPQDRSFLRPASLSGSINVSDLQFRYDETRLVLNIKGLNFQPSERVAILGVNGSGKSSLLKVISGLYDFETGSVAVGNLDIRQIDPTIVRNVIGLLPQEVHLFSGTLRENLSFGSARFNEITLLKSLKFAGLSEFVKSDPRGLDLIIKDGGVGLSLGQRQCVGIARLYLQDPQIVLMDEPTASLDQGLETEIIKRFGSWLTGRTCLITTHRVPPLALTTRVIVLQNGHVVLDEPTETAIQKLSTNSNVKKEGTDDDIQRLSA